MTNGEGWFIGLVRRCLRGAIQRFFGSKKIDERKGGIVSANRDAARASDWRL
jgi:hypothetical protein